MMRFVSNIFQLLPGGKPMQSAQVLEHHDPTVSVANSPRFLEMRQATRLTVSAVVSYRLKGSRAPWLSTISRDYSSSGIRMVLLSPVKPGTHIEMKIALPEVNHLIHMQGVVVWVAQTSHRYAQERVIECGVVFNKVQENTHKEKLIYLIANKLCHLGIKSTQHLTAAPVQTLEDLKACYRIVYEGYTARGYCAPNPSRMYYHYYSFLPESRTFVLKDKDEILGTISLIVDSPCGLPMDNLFSREINQIRAGSRKLAEVSLLAMAHHEKKKKLFSLTNFEKQAQLFRLFKIAYEYAFYAAGVTDFVIGVHPKHETLYKYLLFRNLGSPKSYPQARGNPALPLHLDLHAAKQNYTSCLRDFFIGRSSTEEILHNGFVPDAQVVRKFLCEEQLLWPKMPEKVKKYYKECFQQNSFDDYDFVRI